MTAKSLVVLVALLVLAPLSAARSDAADAFSGTRSRAHLEAVCDLGPRPSGSDAMRRQRAMLTEHFRSAGAVVTGQAFRIRDRHSGQPVHIENLVVVWHPDRAERILVAAHYDTRPFPDRDPVDPRGVFIGANDGASGVAVLMEMARCMRELSGPGVDFVLFDAEEYVVGPRDPYCLGSTYFARQYAAARREGTGPTYRCGVVLDMIGDRDLAIWQEQKSVSWPDTKPIVDSIWAVAARLGARQFVPRPLHEVEDDHVPLRTIGRIPTCDIIDFDYPVWHTTRDVPAACSAESLETVGRVMLAWLREQR
ncbi:MAG: M28 family peptidase [Planctomycetes bacterium]|nr:M28 family peptidase [Planctomycetota bacterium]MBM4057071.1 M28 family peptidase [Planctomycetota bacterium]